MTGRNWERAALTALLGALGLWLGVRYVFPAVLPFAIGLAVAALAQPMTRRCERFAPRWAASFLSVCAVYASLGLGLWLLTRVLAARLGALAPELPALLRSAAGSLAQASDALCRRAPAELEASLRAWTESLLARSEQLGQKLTDAVLAAVGGAVSALPNALVFAVTAVLSSFMLCARLPEIRRAVRQRLPLRIRSRLRQGAEKTKNALGLWLRAELRLMAVTFAICTAGLLVLRVRRFLGMAALTAMVDALPLLGSGTVLLPWGAACMLRGQTRRGIGLALLYAACALTRTTLEPRLLGRHLGLSPLMTLGALYTGFRLCGVAGMIFFPIGAMLLGQLLELWDGAQKPQT